jgi:hypothetical protein
MLVTSEAKQGPCLEKKRQPLKKINEADRKANAKMGAMETLE